MKKKTDVWRSISLENGVAKPVRGGEEIAEASEKSSKKKHRRQLIVGGISAHLALASAPRTPAAARACMSCHDQVPVRGRYLRSGCFKAKNTIVIE